MEAVKNVANAASSYLGYGQNTQSGEEPVSGQTGEGTGTEPYDAGNNVDDATLGGSSAQQTSSSSLNQSGTEPISGMTGSGTADEPYDAGNEQSDSALGGSAPQQSSSTAIGGSGLSSSTTGAGSSTSRHNEPYEAGNSGERGFGGSSSREIADRATGGMLGDGASSYTGSQSK